jgi:hypothetical protein
MEAEDRETPQSPGADNAAACPIWSLWCPGRRRSRSARYASFAEMLEHEKVSAISGTGESRDDLLAAIRDLYDEEKEALGVLALELRIVSDEPQ